MCDFVLRTFQHLAAQVDPHDPTSSPMFEDVIGRASQAKFFTMDETGHLNKMNASVGYKDDDGVEFTNEIRDLANTLDKFIDGCAGCAKEKRDNGKLPMVCARCKEEEYCSTECQKKRWKSHKRECKPAPATAAEFQDYLGSRRAHRNANCC